MPPLLIIYSSTISRTFQRNPHCRTSRPSSTPIGSSSSMAATDMLLHPTTLMPQFRRLSSPSTTTTTIQSPKHRLTLAWNYMARLGQVQESARTLIGLMAIPLGLDVPMVDLASAESTSSATISSMLRSHNRRYCNRHAPASSTASWPKSNSRTSSATWLDFKSWHTSIRRRSLSIWMISALAGVTKPVQRRMNGLRGSRMLRIDFSG